jgi:hypothetical protein
MEARWKHRGRTVDTRWIQLQRGQIIGCPCVQLRKGKHLKSKHQRARTRLITWTIIFSANDFRKHFAAIFTTPINKRSTRPIINRLLRARVPHHRAAPIFNQNLQYPLQAFSLVEHRHISYPLSLLSAQELQ